MDPLSIAGSVSGLLAMSTAIVSALEKFTSAYSLAEIVHREMREFRSVLAQLQPLALGSSFSDIARASMIELRHVEVTLVGCLCTFSDLEREVDRLGAPGSTSLYIRFKWTRAQSTLNGLVQQLQNHKATLALMLAIMTCQTHAVAMENMLKLQTTMEQLMVQLNKSAPSLKAASITSSALSTSSIQSNFERVLQRTRLYKRSSKRESTMIFSNSSCRLPGWSVLSGRSLSEVSNLSIYELPIYASDLYNPHWFSALFPAAEAGNTNLVSSCLREPMSHKQRIRGLNKALFLAVNGNHRATVALLLEQGADTNLRDGGGDTALLVATRGRDEKLVQLLLEHGADIEAKDVAGAGALHIAVKTYKHETVVVLLKNSASTEAKDADGDTALHIAVMTRQPATTEALLKNDANTEAKRVDGSTALHIAVIGSPLRLVRLLLKYGANTEAKRPSGETSLHIAVRGGKYGSVELLLANGANKESKTTNGETALHLAVGSGQAEMSRLLLEKGAKTEAKRMDGDTALHLASRMSDDSFVLLLVAYGADMHAVNEQGKPAWDTGDPTRAFDPYSLYRLDPNDLVSPRNVDTLDNE